MNLDELQSVQARERQSSDLQHLRPSFYKEVGEFIEQLDGERARAVEAADDPFSDPEIRRLTDDIETAKSTVEAIYERRVGKVVKKASIAAADMPVEEDGLTDEEAVLFEDLVARIERNRETVLSVLDGDAPTVSCSVDDGDEAVSEPTPDREATPAAETPSDPGAQSAAQPSDVDPEGTSDGVSAADLMGDTGTEDAPADRTPPDRTPDARRGNRGEGAVSESVGTESAKPTAGADPEAVSEPPRTTVKITADVGEIVGADDRDYELSSEDVVTLPEPNADVLVEKDAAERLPEYSSQ